MVGSLALAVLLEPGEDTSVDKRILRKLQWRAERINGLLDFDDVIGVWISAGKRHPKMNNTQPLRRAFAGGQRG